MSKFNILPCTFSEQNMQNQMQQKNVALASKLKRHDGVKKRSKK